MSPIGPEDLLLITLVVALVVLLWGGMGLGVAIVKLRLNRRTKEGTRDSAPNQRSLAPAGRGKRLLAVLIDAALASPLIFIASEAGYADTDRLEPIGLVALLGAGVLANVQVYLFAARGQTIGKQVMRIRVVDAPTGRHPGWFRLVVLRLLVNRIFVAVTFSIYGLVDALFIFRKDRRTVHDLMARTRVIQLR